MRFAYIDDHFIFKKQKFVHNVRVQLIHSYVKIPSPIFWSAEKSFYKKIRLPLKLI